MCEHTPADGDQCTVLARHAMRGEGRGAVGGLTVRCRTLTLALALAPAPAPVLTLALTLASALILTLTLPLEYP